MCYFLQLNLYLILFHIYKYQVETFNDGVFIVVLNTETGVMKTFRILNSNDGWVEEPNLPAITFTH